MFFNAGNIGLPIAGRLWRDRPGGDGDPADGAESHPSPLSGAGERCRGGLRTALMGLLRIPVVYAIVAALLLRWGGLSLPAGVMVLVGYLSDA